MAYRLNSYIAEQTSYRFHASERHYIEQLEARGGLIRLDNVEVDAEQLVLRAFTCDTRWCLRKVQKDGAAKCAGSCCTDLEVNLTPDEIERLKKLGAMALEVLQFGKNDPVGAVARHMAAGRFSERTDAGDLALVHRRGGCCELGWLTREGTLRCAINALCYALDVPLGEYKPDPCLLFPLHTVEYLPGRHFVTVVCAESHRAVGADAYVARLRCVRRPQPGAPPAVISLKYELIHCFGAAFYRALAAAAVPYLEREGLEEAAEQLRKEVKVTKGVS